MPVRTATFLEQAIVLPVVGRIPKILNYMDSYSNQNPPSSFIRQLRGLLFCCFLLFTLPGNLPAQSATENSKMNPGEGNPDSLQVVTAIATSRDIHRNKHEEALEYAHAEKAVALALTMADTLLYAQALDNLGLLYRYHQGYEEAINLHAKAFKLIKEKEGTSLPQMIYANNAGVASRYAGEYNQAVEFYLEALTIAEQEKDLKNIAISSNGMGNTLSHIPNRAEDALRYFERSLEAESQRGNTLGMAMNYLSISDFYIRKGAYSTAREYLDKLLTLNKEREDTFGLAMTYEFYGISYLEEGRRLDKADRYFQQAFELFSGLNNTHKQADVLFHLGDANRLRERYASAIDYYTRSRRLAEEIDSKGLLMESAHKLSAVYEAQGKLGESLKYYKLFQQYKDSVALIEQETQIAAIEKRFALENKESRIALLEKDKVLQQARLKSQEETLGNQQLLLLLLLLGLFAIVVIATMQYRNIKEKKRSNRLLKQQNQQIIAQRDEISMQKDKIEKVNSKLEETFEELISQQKKNEERRVKLLESTFENKIQSLTLQSLESQMNPHFLFNGMNAVRWLVIQNKNEKAKIYLDTFANLLRLSLTNNRKKVIALSEELQTTSLYLEIEKLRFDSEFSFTVHIAPGINTDQLMVPPKILQPLAENAVKHGLLPSRKVEKKLEINVIEKEGGVCVEVVDNGRGFRKGAARKNESRPDGTHLGLKLIRERLSIYNQQHDSLILFNIEAHQDENMQVTGTRAEIWMASERVMQAVKV